MEICYEIGEKKSWLFFIVRRAVRRQFGLLSYRREHSKWRKYIVKGEKWRDAANTESRKKNNCFNPGAFVFVIEIRRLTLKRLALVIKDPYNRVADGWEKQQAEYNTQFWCYNKRRVLQWDLFREIKHYNTFTCCSY